jgi:hypothetical protein
LLGSFPVLPVSRALLETSLLGIARAVPSFIGEFSPAIRPCSEPATVECGRVVDMDHPRSTAMVYPASRLDLKQA